MSYYYRFGNRTYYDRRNVLTPHHINMPGYHRWDTPVHGPLINYRAWTRNVAAQRNAQMRYNIINAGMRRYGAPPEIGQHVMSFLPQGQVMAPYRRTFQMPARRRTRLSQEDRTMQQLIRAATTRIRADLPPPPEAARMDDENVDDNDEVEPANKRQYNEDEVVTQAI